MGKGLEYGDDASKVPWEGLELIEGEVYSLRAMLGNNGIYLGEDEKKKSAPHIFLTRHLDGNPALFGIKVGYFANKDLHGNDLNPPLLCHIMPYAKLPIKDSDKGEYESLLNKKGITRNKKV